MTDSGPASPPARWILGLGLTAMLVPLNSTMIAVALPVIADDFDIAKGTAGLLITVYLLVMVVGQPIAGRLADVVGIRRVVALGLTGFAACSLAASFADAFWLVVAGRCAQAVFGAALIPGARALLRIIMTEDRWGRSFGIQESLIGAGAAGGPLVGGIVTELVGWPGVFLVNVPVAVLALVILRDIPARSAPPPARASEGSRLRDVLTERLFGLAFVTQAAAVLGQYRLLLVVPVVLHSRGWSPSAFGAALILLTIGMVVIGPVGDQLGDTYGRRLPVLAGVVVATACVALAAAFVDGSPAALLVAMCAFGLGLATPNLTTAALGSVPEHLVGSASGLWSMSRYFGSIPASLLFAFIVSDNVDGARALLLIAAAAGLLAVLSASFIPKDPGVRP